MLESGDIGAIRGLRHTTAGDLLHLGCPSLLSSSFLLPVLSAFGDDDHGCSHSEDFFLSSSSSCSYSLLNETTLACNHESSSSSVKEMEDREENRRSKESRETEETEEALTSGALKEQTKKMIGESSSLVHTPPSLETSSTPSHRHYGRHSLSGTHYRRRRERGHFARLLPVCFSSLECANSREEEQVEAALAATSLSDVALRYTRDESGKFTLWGMGELHLQVIQATLREQFGISTEFGPLEVGYREYLLRPMKGSMVSSSSSSSSLKQRHPRHPTSLSSSSSSPNAFSVTISLSPLPLTPPEQRLAAFLNRKPDPACLVLADVANQVASTSAWSGLMSRSLSSTKRKIHESPSKSPHSSSAVGRDSGFLSSSLQHSTDVFFSLSFTALGQLQALDEGDKHHGDRGMLSHRGSNQKSLRRKHNEDESRSAINIHHSHRHHRVHSDEMTLLGRHGLAVFEAIQQALHHALCAGPLLSYPLDLVHVCLESISHDGSLLPSTAAGACAQLLRLLLRTGKGQQIQREKRATSSSSQKGSKDHSRQLGKKKKISFTNDLTDEETTNDSEDSEIDEGGEEEEDVRERAGLLEPIMHLEIYSPAKCLGPLMRDLSQNRRASVVSITAAAGGREEEEEEEGSSFSSDVMTVNGLGSERRGRGERDMVEDKMMELHATVPLRCMGDYSSILRALSHGQAHFQLRPVGYGRVCPTDEEDLLNKQLFGSSSSYQSQHHEETESFSYMSSRKKSYSSSSSLTL
ncbi:elongation factor g c-terminus domain-containing protein [Cystoisospora suis]|uniref:Elongation factor g c-terminus domain-containing protein n=1 Tax=Cystoisospora suis TaxID=483139 RepID=A0A2C6L7S6_9APIC|nr:elongation factor g c-terminus domain-containing protein [Cystoisospora suis]